ncbi:MaoC family dehydratase [Ferrimonas balearica]|uniref:MaoC family dehydratase n=1 Tax=Ferrimonas balearica TaxID=44012 RepID=UPI001C98F60D|nr:MaoC/PaaZ C-terminal domain-containing protein [Ferrimonas balearica]MBY5991872.1 hypothetical protein [Ferrimonas balearica]
MNQTLKPSDIPSNLSLVWKGFVKRCEQGALPAMEVKVEGFRFDASKRRRYNAFCGFDADTLPLSYLFVATQPIQLVMLTDKEMPVQPLGMIHLGVGFEVLTEMDADGVYDVVMKVGEQGTTEKGLEFELVGEFYQGETCCARYTSRCLLRLPAEGGRRRRRAGARAPKVEYDWQTLETLALAPQVARGYARISGDYNPIHLHRITAKPFGFDAPIAHGMYMVAKMLSAVKTPLKGASFDFKRPVLMPGTGTIERDGRALRLANSAGKPLVEATLDAD